MRKSDVTTATRRFVRDRAKGYCEYCRSHIDGITWYSSSGNLTIHKEESYHHAPLFNLYLGEFGTEKVTVTLESATINCQSSCPNAIPCWKPSSCVIPSEARNLIIQRTQVPRCARNDTTV